MNAQSIIRWLIVAAAASCMLSACGDDAPSSPSIVEASFGEPCRYEKCSNHGECREASAGGPTCLCNVGYMGGRCTTCETGFHVDSLGRCAPDRSCSEQPSNPCGDHGGCDDSDGVIVCDCKTGYEGPRCTLCADGFDHDQFDECLMRVLGGTGGASSGPPTNEPPDDGSGGTQPGGGAEPPALALCTDESCNGHGACKGDTGRIECTCDTAHSGPRCASCAAQNRRDDKDDCVPFDTCSNDSCGAHGDCSVSSGVAVCACDAGWSAAKCDACAPGFHEQSLECVLDQSCMTNSCAGHGTCAASGASVNCTCGAGYDGANCEKCATGYHRDPGDACVINEVCGANDCGAHGDCDAGGGVIVCMCDDGYAGDDCDKCAPGFHDGGSGNCVLDQQCQPGSCATHSVCDESSGVVECMCNAGYGGAKCDACASGYYRDYASNDCLVFVCEDNPISAAGTLMFEDVKWFPNYTNNCGTKADLNTSDVVLTSIAGDGTVWSCAPSDIYDLMTRHALLEAGVIGPAELKFAGPISTLSFDYAAKSALSLDVLGDGSAIGSISAAKNSHASMSFTFTAPITVFALRSTTAFTNEIALDNVAYSPPACQ